MSFTMHPRHGNLEFQPVLSLILHLAQPKSPKPSEVSMSAVIAEAEGATFSDGSLSEGREMK